MTLFHAVLSILGALVVGGGLGYGFRGKENAAIKALGKDVSSAATDVSKKL